MLAYNLRAIKKNSLQKVEMGGPLRLAACQTKWGSVRDPTSGNKTVEGDRAGHFHQHSGKCSLAHIVCTSQLHTSYIVYI